MIAYVEEISLVSAAPEPGQLVEVRSRRWLVSELEASSIQSSPESRQHLVSLSSVEDDALGERLEVIWEIEPGARVIEKAGLPEITGQDDPEALQAFMDAVRWGAATNADKTFVQAPFRSGVSIEEFQLEPLVRAVDMARVNLLIADDVGLGKTIEAGLIVQEMLIRHRIRTVMVICPASLQEKWRIEMLEKFGLEFRVVNTEYIKTLRRERGIHVNPWTSYPRLIASIDWIKTGEPLRLLREIVPTTASFPRKFDLMIVDEAHNIAPSGSAQYVLESQRTRVIRSLAGHFQHKLFLTATPHNGYTQSFTALLELLDDQRFSRSILPNERQLGRVMVRRLKTDLVDANGKALYPARRLEPLIVNYTDDERSVHATLDAYCKQREVTCKAHGGSNTRFINALLKKRLLSSPAAFATTIEKHFESIGHAPRGKASKLDERILRRALERAEEDYADDSDFENAQIEAVEAASVRVPALSHGESELMNQLRQWGAENRNRRDSKAEAILDWLRTEIKPAGSWSDERVILFTEYRTTHRWLEEILVASGFGGSRLMSLHGGMDAVEREEVKAAFQTDPKDSDVRILLATDAASEGIDLQNHCNKLIHLEIPYNPNVMEQRNGRVDRHGQRRDEVIIWHPVDGGDDAETTVGGHRDNIIRALRKLESMRNDMGCVNPVIAPQMAGLLSGERTAIDTTIAERRSAEQRRYVKAERQLNERVARLRDQLDETRRDFHLEPERVAATVRTALALNEKPPLREVELAGAPEGTVFEMPELGGTWAKCAEGLRHPYTGKVRPITFDHSVAHQRDDVVLVHLNHRLAQMSLRVLRAQVWARHDTMQLHRAAVRRLIDETVTDPIVVVVSRLVVAGGNHHRLHEELTLAGGHFRQSGFVRETKVTPVNDWFEQSIAVRLAEEPFAELSALYERNTDAIASSISARSRERARALNRTLENRKLKEVEDIRNVLDELERSIRSELDLEREPEQYELFSEDERLQLRRDRDALRARLERIPAERDLEIAAIEHRYDGIQEHTFPIAVFFLLPSDASAETIV